MVIRDSHRRATYLLARGKRHPDALHRALRLAQDSGEAPEPILTRLGLVTERDMAEAFAHCLNLPIANLTTLADPATLAPFSPSFLRSVHILPLSDTEAGLTVAMANPNDDQAADALALVGRRPILRQVATQTDIDAALDHLLQPEPASGPGATAAGTDLERLRDLASDAPVIRLVDQVLARAVDGRASDIHLETAADRLILRNRIDGVMREADAPPWHRERP